MLKKPERYTLFEHIRQNGLEKGIFVDHVNGHHDHVHALISLRPDQCVADCVKMLKGESSFWANHKSRLFGKKLKWADDYYAVSVGEKDLPRVRAYIRNQEQHHILKTFIEECHEFMEQHGFTQVLGDEEPN
jgi:putative transposase